MREVSLCPMCKRIMLVGLALTLAYHLKDENIHYCDCPVNKLAFANLIALKDGSLFHLSELRPLKDKQ